MNPFEDTYAVTIHQTFTFERDCSGARFIPQIRLKRRLLLPNVHCNLALEAALQRPLKYDHSDSFVCIMISR